LEKVIYFPLGEKRVNLAEMRYYSFKHYKLFSWSWELGTVTVTENVIKSDV
jgi:hypothetical protein